MGLEVAKVTVVQVHHRIDFAVVRLILMFTLWSTQLIENVFKLLLPTSWKTQSLLYKNETVNVM